MGGRSTGPPSTRTLAHREGGELFAGDGHNIPPLVSGGTGRGKGWAESGRALVALDSHTLI
jgi:hypothetical protein